MNQQLGKSEENSFSFLLIKNKEINNSQDSENIFNIEAKSELAYERVIQFSPLDTYKMYLSRPISKIDKTLAKA